jgi:hypothetical protein
MAATWRNLHLYQLFTIYYVVYQEHQGLALTKPVTLYPSSQKGALRGDSPWVFFCDIDCHLPTWGERKALASPGLQPAQRDDRSGCFY